MKFHFVGKLKTKLIKPSDIKSEEEGEYYCVRDVPDNGIATYHGGIFIPTSAFISIIQKDAEEIDRLKQALVDKEIQYDILKARYEKLLRRNQDDME